MLIRNLVTAKRPSTKTSTNSPRLSSVDFHLLVLFVRMLAVFECEEQEQSSISMYKYEQKRYSVRY